MTTPQRMLVVVAAVASFAVMPATAAALNPLKPICTAAGLLSGLAGKACSVAQHGGRLLGAGKKLITGHVGGAIKTALGENAGPVARAATYTLGLGAIAVWAAGGARSALADTAKVIGSTTRPRLTAPWFSHVYWRVAGISVLLTVPFLFAAAIQALLRSDLTLLARAAFGYLPLAMLAVAVAAQLTALLLGATDTLGALVQDAAGSGAGSFLGRVAAGSGLVTLASHSPFLAFVVAAFTVLAAVALWIELMMREAAVYVIVAMLPLAFAALVWPARRVWAQRAVELLAALILSKLAIVAVLTLAGAALSQFPSPTAFMTGVVLLMLGAFAPWAMMRLVPVAELSAGVAGRLRAELAPAQKAGLTALGTGAAAHDWVAATTAQMRDGAEDIDAGGLELRELERLAAAEAPTEAAGDERGTAGRPHVDSDGHPDGPDSPGARGDASPDGRDGTRDGQDGAPGEPDASAGPAEDGSATGERLPGLGPRWQTEDFTWSALDLDAEGEWTSDAWRPPDPIEPPPPPDPEPPPPDEDVA
jgi:hypothetical protein